MGSPTGDLAGCVLCPGHATTLFVVLVVVTIPFALLNREPKVVQNEPESMGAERPNNLGNRRRH